jgi:hypothetical protein
VPNCDPNCPRKASGTCYSHHGCRCDVCKKANAARCNKRRKKRDPSKLPPEKHGKKSSYSNWNCRCDECTAAWNEYQNKRYNSDPKVREYYKDKAKARYDATHSKESSEAAS